LLGAGVLTFRMIKRYGFDLMELGLGLCLLLGLPELRPLFIMHTCFKKIELAMDIG